MNKISSIFIRGFLTFLPLALTIYILATVARIGENLLGAMLRDYVLKDSYLPGLGLLVTLLIIFLIGLLVTNLVTASFLRSLENFLVGLPVIKVVYRPLRDLMALFSKGNESGSMKMVVLVEMNPGVNALGLVTKDNFDDLEGLAAYKASHIAVYFPLSYALGGFTYLVERSKIKPINVPVEKAMSLAITGWISAENNPENLKR